MDKVFHRLGYQIPVQAKFYSTQRFSLLWRAENIACSERSIHLRRGRAQSDIKVHPRIYRVSIPKTWFSSFSTHLCVMARSSSLSSKARAGSTGLIAPLFAKRAEATDAPMIVVVAFLLPVVVVVVVSSLPARAVVVAFLFPQLAADLGARLPANPILLSFFCL